MRQRYFKIRQEDEQDITCNAVNSLFIVRGIVRTLKILVLVPLMQGGNKQLRGEIGTAQGMVTSGYDLRSSFVDCRCQDGWYWNRNEIVVRWGRYNNRDVWEIMMYFIVGDHSGTMKLTMQTQMYKTMSIRMMMMMMMMMSMSTRSRDDMAI